MDIKKAVIYCRVSTKEQVEEGNSLVTQERICREYAAKNGYEIAEVFIEQGESAKTIDRTELQNLLKYCYNHKKQIHAVIAYKLDRIARHTGDYGHIKMVLKRYGVEIKSTSEHFEDTPAGRFMENIISNVAQFDNDMRAERCAGGMKEALREGRYVWMAPIGYSNVKVGGKATIAQNEKASLIKRAFELVAQNLTHTEEIRKMMDKEGLKAKSGKTLARSHFYKLFKNELYMGWMNKFKERQKGLFEPIVSEELFALANRALKSRSRHTLSYTRENPDFPLRRFVMHPSGIKLTGYWSKGRSKRYAYYRFNLKGFEYPKATLENEFEIFMSKYTFNETLYSKLKKAVQKHLVDATLEKRKEAEQLESYIKSLKDKQTALIQKNIQGVITDSILKEELNRIENAIADAQAVISISPQSTTNAVELLALVKDFLKSPYKTWRNAKPELKLKLQWLEFPKGIIFDGLECRTTEVCSIFKAKEMFSSNQSLTVDLRVKKASFTTEVENSPAHNVDTISENSEFWNKFATELSYLADILK